MRIVFVTCPPGAGAGLVTALLEARLIAGCNILPGVRSLGLELRREEDMTRGGFLARRPSLVVVADNFGWMWSSRQNAFVAWLLEGPPGYRVVRFGPEAEGRSTTFLHEGPRSRIWPNVAILVRE